jgi:chemotaxis protein CheD
MRTHFLNQAQIFANRLPHEITTVLGSCIAVCLWDRQKKFGGMNHFVLPMWNGRGLASPKYGNIAIKKLIEKMDQLGGNKKNYIAKVFGGCNVIGSGDKPPQFQIGDRNAEYALHALEQEKIIVVAKKTQATHGLKIMMNSATSEILLRPIVPITL